MNETDREQNPINTHSHLPLVHVKRANNNRFNPLPGLVDRDEIAKKIDSFEAGYLDAVNILDALQQRDDLVRTVVSKRKKLLGLDGLDLRLRSCPPEGRNRTARSGPPTLLRERPLRKRFRRRRTRRL